MSDQLILPPFQKKYDLKAKNLASLILMAIRFFGIITCAIPLLLIQNYIVPIIVFPYIRRYVSCISNLILIRIIFIFLGVFKFQCHDFRFFDKTSPKFHLKSGFIGVAQHKNIIDFLYYKYLFNPVFVRIIIVKTPQNKREAFYSPLSHFQAWSAAFSHRGFQPIVVNGLDQLKKLRRRKMAIKTLVSQCFEQIHGPILILLPGIDMNSNVCIQPVIAQDIHEIQTKFLRSCVGFSMKYNPYNLFKTCYQNQAHLIIKILGSFTINKLIIQAIVFRKFKTQYNKQNYNQFIDKFFEFESKPPRKIKYQDYLIQIKQRQLSNENYVVSQKKKQTNNEKQKKDFIQKQRQILNTQMKEVQMEPDIIY